MRRMISCFLFLVLILSGCKGTVEYVELELPTSMFYYDLNYGEEFEKVCHIVEQEDSDEELSNYYLLDGKKGQMIFYDESLYCEKAYKEALESYYKENSNYEWFIEFEENDGYIRFPLDVTEDEKEKLYAMDQAERKDTLFLNEVTKMATLLQVSKDQVICSKINLLYYNDVWYWQTEIIDEDVMKGDYYAEYVHALPNTLIDKINDI